VVFAWGIHWVYIVGIFFCLASTVVLMATQADLMDKPSSTPHVSPWLVARQESAKLATVGMTATILAMMRTVRQIGIPLWGLYIGLHPGKVALIIGIAGAVDFALFYVSGQIMDRFGRRWAVVPSLVGLAVTHLALVFAQTEPAFLWVAIAMSIANATGSGIVLTIGADLAPEGQRNEFLAAYRLLIDSGQAVTPLLVSGMTLAASLPVAIVVMSGLSLFGAGLGWKYLPKFGIR
jgi:MFS family permease